MRPNIYDLLRNEFIVFDTSLDVGCAGLCDLVDLENSPFRKLIGIDKQFDTTPFGDYRRRKLKDLDLSDEQFRIVSKELMLSFNQRFTIETLDLFDYDFMPNTNSFIICNKVLHFYANDIKLNLIDKFYSSLQNQGLLYLKINHNLHPVDTDPGKMIKIGENIYQSIDYPGYIKYLIDPNEFVKELPKSYNILEKYTDKNDKTLTIVLRK